MSGLNFEAIVNKGKKVGESNKKGCLILVPAPTGSGKTYSSVNYISKRIVMSGSFRAFMVTTQVRTIPQKEFFYEIIKEYEAKYGEFKSNEEKQAFFYRHVAVLKSLENSIKCLIADSLPKSIEVAVSQQFKALRAVYMRYNQQTQLAEAHLIMDNQELKRAYWDFKSVLLTEITRILMLTKPLGEKDKIRISNYVAQDKTELAHFLNRHFPTIDLKQRQLILCTWSKFIQTYQSFYSHASIQVSSPQCLGDALVVLDEIDEMKPILVDKIIDNSVKLPIDSLPLFNQIFSGVNKTQKKRTESVMSVLRKDKKFSTFKRHVNTLVDKYELERDYKTIHSKYRTNFIFNLDSLTITSSDKWWSKRSKLVRQVLLTNKRPDEQGDLHFYEMLRKVRDFFNVFIKLLTIWSSNYQSNINNKRQDVDNALSMENAMKTICDSLGLTSPDTKNLIVKMYWHYNELKNYSEHLKKKTDIKYGRYLQSNGLSLVSLTDSDSHLNRTEIRMAVVQNTPEKFLLKLVNRGTVIGMSATVDLNTVISNFDFDFLKEQIGSRLINGLEDIPQEVKDELDVSERCREKGVSVKVLETKVDSNFIENGHCIRYLLKRDISDDSCIVKSKKKLRLLEDVVQQLMLDIHSYYYQKSSQKGSRDDKKYKFVQKRYVELFDSFIIFLSNQSMTTCLGLQSILPKVDSEPEEIQMSASRIKRIFNLLSDFISDGRENIPQLRMIAKKFTGSVEDQIYAALELPAEKKTRVYLLSAYKTLGVSQNLQHQTGDLEKTRVINIAPKLADKNDSRRLMVDISGIYLGQITQLFTQIPEKATLDNESEWIRGYYELYSLVDSDEISLLEVDRYARKQHLGIPVKQFRHTISYVGAHTRVVLQALGRLDRSFNKMPEITVMLGTDVLNYFNVSMKEDYQLGPVAQAMKEFQKQKRRLVIDETATQREQYSNRTFETQERVGEMVDGLRKSTRTARQYQMYREYLISHPTVSFRQYHKVEKKPEFAYLNNGVTSYSVQRIGEKFWFKENGEGNEEISESASGLSIMLKYPGMLEHFKRNNWAISWKKNEFIMNPVQFDNYLGILGEVVGKFILEHEWKVRLDSLITKNNELFDFQTEQRVLVDFKVWNYPHEETAGSERRKIIKKLEKFCENEQSDIKTWRVLIVNVLEPEMNKKVIPQKLVNKQIMEIPYILDNTGKFALNVLQKRVVGEFLNGKAN